MADQKAITIFNLYTRQGKDGKPWVTGTADARAALKLLRAVLESETGAVYINFYKNDYKQGDNDPDYKITAKPKPRPQQQNQQQNQGQNMAAPAPQDDDLPF